jgi:hypothetical protein
MAIRWDNICASESAESRARTASGSGASNAKCASDSPRPRGWKIFSIGWSQWKKPLRVRLTVAKCTRRQR